MILLFFFILSRDHTQMSFGQQCPGAITLVRPKNNFLFLLDIFLHFSILFMYSQLRYSKSCACPLCRVCIILCIFFLRHGPVNFFVYCPVQRNKICDSVGNSYYRIDVNGTSYNYPGSCYGTKVYILIYFPSEFLTCRNHENCWQQYGALYIFRSF